MLQDTGEMGGLPYLLCSVSFIPLAGKSVISILYIVGVSDSKNCQTNDHPVYIWEVQWIVESNQYQTELKKHLRNLDTGVHVCAASICFFSGPGGCAVNLTFTTALLHLLQETTDKQSWYFQSLRNYLVEETWLTFGHLKPECYERYPSK